MLFRSGASIFNDDVARELRERDMKEQKLNDEIVRLKMELDWVKKLLSRVEDRRSMIEPEEPSGISIRRQCDLIGLNRSTFYHDPTDLDNKRIRWPSLRSYWK